ncbi:MAG: hypothetical protein KGI50_05430 [Patescibacteria group bacterium]|nr:hypothetical protein [Patescibacteria group bacterium]MDE2438753.1 hypothetical protein [Patescibacteria group bacterium]
MIRITVTVKDDHSKLTKSFEEEEILLSTTSAKLLDLINETITEFGRLPEEVIVKTSMDI